MVVGRSILKIFMPNHNEKSAHWRFSITWPMTLSMELSVLDHFIPIFITIVVMIAHEVLKASEIFSIYYYSL